MSVLTIRGVDTSGPNYGFWVDQANGLRSAPAITAEESQVFDIPGAQASAHQVEPMDVVIRGKVKGSSPADVTTKLDNLKSLLWQDTKNVPLGYAHVSGRERLCEYRSFEEREMNGLDTFHFARAQVTMGFRATFPYMTALADTIVPSIQATPVSLPMGSAELRLDIQIAGSATNPRLAVQNAGGVEQAFLQITGTVGGGDTLYVNMQSRTIYINDPTDPANNRLSWWTGGEWWVMDPAWWDFVASTNPTLSCSSGVAQATYRQTFL